MEENIAYKKFAPESVKSGCIRAKLLSRKHFVFIVTTSLITGVKEQLRNCSYHMK